jgi:mediator of RNA polymerase II transcription subunit 14
MAGRAPNRSKLPLLGGTLTMSIVEAHSAPQVGGGPARSSRARVLADLQQRSKLGGHRPSDEVESLKFEIGWEPANGALGVTIPAEEAILVDSESLLVSSCLL